MLPSGLPEHVDDEENLARFLTQGNQFSSTGVKAAAFLPHPLHQNSSVFRENNEPERLKEIWSRTATGERVLKGVALLKAIHVRQAKADVMSEEPPDAHANIVGWKWLAEDPELQKSEQKEMALLMSTRAELIRI